MTAVAGDASLTRQLAALMGWEVVGPQTAADYGEGHLYVDLEGRYYRKTDKGWVEWRPLVDMSDAMTIVEHLKNKPEEDRYWCEMRTPWKDGDKYKASFTAWGYIGVNGRPDYTALADSLERAVCLAALAVEVLE